MLDYNNIEAAEVKQHPYPYAVISNAIREDVINAAVSDFPDIHHSGSIPLESVEGGKAFDELIDDLQSEKFKRLIEKKFSIAIGDRPSMVTLRGQMRRKDGRIHTDSKTKLITVLLYLNDDWRDEGGHLRILNNGDDLDDFVEEIPPKAGTMVIFKVTDNCWHGHKPVEGRRNSIQLNYLTSSAAKGKHDFFHGLSAKIKNVFSGSR